MYTKGIPRTALFGGEIDPNNFRWPAYRFKFYSDRDFENVQWSMMLPEFKKKCVELYFISIEFSKNVKRDF